jgi:hypothetical protein
VVFREGKRYTAPNGADDAILNNHFSRDFIEEPKPIEKHRTERETEEILDDNLPPEPPKPHKISLELAAIESALGDAWRPPAEGSPGNFAGKVALYAQLALEDDDFEIMIHIYTAAVISDDHNDGIDNPKSYKLATESPLAEKCDTLV